MSSALDQISEAEIDRLRELAHIGASWAATAFARLVGRTILTRVPLVHGPDRFRKRGEWETGIFCVIEGALDGVVAVFLPKAPRDAVLELLCKRQSPPKEMAASALTEFGSILTSQTVSAIADTIGGRILPGVPELVLENAETALQARMSPRHRPPPPLYIESELFDRQGDFRALHVVLPQVPKAATRIR
ncbi:MAG: chemotaxis protein CheC [Myxococcales bacterium]|nr:chemotaxis protein CheC [Myxococcales bacterium]MDH5567116.1 chemotaxis protein CheC [Myxococcales bacterium]